MLRERGGRIPALTASDFLFAKRVGKARTVEGGSPEMVDTVAALARAEIPVNAHRGLAPRSVNALESFRVQGRGEGDREHMGKRR